MARPAINISRPSDDDAQTTFMSRAMMPAMPPRSSRAPVFNEERTHVHVPPPSSARPRMPSDDGERTIVAPMVFPKAPRATLITPPSMRSAPPRPTPSARPSQPPPIPSARPVATPLAFGPPPSPMPAVIPPAPPSATRLQEAPAAGPASAIEEGTSSPALVSDVVTATIPPTNVTKSPRAREPMILLAAALGVVGMIFTMGIVVGLVFSLRPAEVAQTSSSRAAAASEGMSVAAALPVKEQPAKVAAATASTDTLSAATAAPALQAPPAPVAAPRSAPIAMAAPAPVRAPRPAPVAMAAPAPRPAAPAPAKRARTGSGDSESDMASAASDLAKAQLEASLR